MSLESRSRILYMISQCLGFDLKEEDLPPLLRRKIGATAKKMDKVDKLEDYQTSLEKSSYTAMSLSILLIIAGFIVLISGVLLVEVFAIIIGLVLLVVAYFLFTRYKHKQTMAKGLQFVINPIWSEIAGMAIQLSQSSYNELSSQYEARVRPTVKHLMVDFASIIQIAKSKGIILSIIECPYCKGTVKIPKTGDTFQCQYCGKTVHAVKIFDKLKYLMA